MSNHLSASPLDGSTARVFVSGLHSGPNPSPGLGVVRSLKLADPQSYVVGVDYSPSSSGLHSSILDDVVCFPSWPDVDTSVWRDEIHGWIRAGGIFIPGLDLEVRLLANEIGDHAQILAPGPSALRFVAKPAVAVANLLGIGTPNFEREVDGRSIDRFLRRHGGWAWVKGQHYEAFRATSSLDALVTGEFIAEAWGGEWHLEEHVSGQECGLAFCARDGVLLDAVMMSKVLQTSDGKTWSGEVHEVEPELRDRLSDFAAATMWTGGGEIEIIRRWDGSLVLLEVNPRFPAWIHGATVCGANLPAALVRNQTSGARRQLGAGFTRVVEELPVNGELGVSSYPWSAGDMVSVATKHPSGMRSLARRHLISSSSAKARHDGSELPHLKDTARSSAVDTPQRIFSSSVYRQRVQDLQRSLADTGDFDLAISVKTCPFVPFLQLAADLGLAAEAISLDELDLAVASGHDPGRAILNGPAKWWPQRDAVRCHAFFADSLAELLDLTGDLRNGFGLRAEVVGVRIAPVMRHSRFGVSLERPSDIEAVVSAMAPLQRHLDAGWGAHFHHAQSVIGTEAWVSEVDRFLALVPRLARRLGPPSIIDLGGGWHADDVERVAANIERVRSRCATELRGEATRWILEPGKSLTEPAAVLQATVLSVCGTGRDRRVIVDAALGDLPEAAYRSHPVAHFAKERWKRLGPGDGKVVGRSCMESDVLARGLDLSSVSRHDTLLFEDCGAYDASMAYAFGRGRMTEVRG